ncbi:MAG: bifunctional phosphoribosylaminoimidazolecarboxamide formyltransferase/IMP cyclohydrolase [Thermoplasmata archaeon]|nr:bifunctional phosphoribosylaminoimidazolecarboxamide formyltransferase/IMP cyclohydrolase [Thermoplasmata archaeon]
MRALISVSDKEGIEKLAQELQNLGFEIISTGGTYRYLKEHGIEAEKVEDVTNFPEILGGRVKTLHPAIMGAILARNAEELKDFGFKSIDVVVVNLYPFEKFIDASEEDMIENIDIGGIALLRAAAKNYRRVIVISSKEQYEEAIKLLREGKFDLEKRREYAIKAFAVTASYDALIYNTFWRRFRGDLPEYLLLALPKAEDLRYGENPHQKGAFYSSDLPFIQHHGKKLSFNNISDMNGAWNLVMEFQDPACAVIKHSNPCGAALGKNLQEAFTKAWNSDPLSAYGSIVAFNRPVDEKVALVMRKKFIEVVIAPGFTPEAMEILKRKKNLRIIEVKKWEKRGYSIRQVDFGFLMQEWNIKKLKNYKVVTEREPTEEELRDLIFAWYVVKHVKSNAIVFARNLATVGIGAGQMSRVDSVKIATMKAEERANNAVMASDAFFPFRDGIDEAHKAGITAVIQPGGSIRDEEVIQAANEHHMAMLFTGYRVFNH